MKKKIKYEAPEVSVISLEGADIITASEGDTPQTPLEW